MTASLPAMDSPAYDLGTDASVPSGSRVSVFLGLEGEQASYEEASAVILPMPFERTVSYGAGTANGPAALLEASAQVELYDEELELEPQRFGFFTAAPFDPEGDDLSACMNAMADEARRHLAADKFLVTLGGEHSLTLAPVRAARDVLATASGDSTVQEGRQASPHEQALGVVQFDAHADLRDSYGGSRYSHAAIMRRIVDDLALPTLAVGIRSLSTPEAQLIRERQLPVIWSHELHDDSRKGCTERFESYLDNLPERIYLTFDLDYFDPSLVPSTGTPEPGGGNWHPTLALLRLLFERKTVVAMDVVELAPVPGHPASDFLAAKLVHKCLGYRFALGRE